MILTFAEDFTNTIQLDGGLIGTSDSGLFWNRGIHPSVNVNNLIELLPQQEFTFSSYSATETYTEFQSSRKKSDVVVLDDVIYLSLKDDNLNHSPDEEDSVYWLQTNIESLRIRSWIWTVEDNAKNALNLTRKLIENQYIYHLGSSSTELPSDYSGWGFQPKGSDYVKIRINEISLQAVTTDPVNLYVINQGVLIDTLILSPDNGKLSFEAVDYTISGKGEFIFAFDSQTVLSDSAYNDPLKYSGFVCYPVTGIGDAPQTATYSKGFSGNGLGFNISAYLDSDVYIDNNKVDYASFFQAQFEYDFFRMALANSNTVSNRTERILTDSTKLNFELYDLQGNTVARRYMSEKKKAVSAVNKTFDKFLKKKTGFKTKRRTI